MYLSIWFFIGYWILSGAGFLSWPLFILPHEAVLHTTDVQDSIKLKAKAPAFARAFIIKYISGLVSPNFIFSIQPFFYQISGNRLWSFQREAKGPIPT